METKVSSEFVRYLRWIEAIPATLTALAGVLAIAFGGDPAIVMSTIFVGIGVVALHLKHYSLVTVAIAFATWVAMIEASARFATSVSALPILVALMLFGFIALVYATLELHENTNVSLSKCFFVVLPIGRLLGIALALTVLAHPGEPFIAGIMGTLGVGVRAVAAFALLVPIAISQAVKLSFHSFYTTQGS